MKNKVAQSQTGAPARQAVERRDGAGAQALTDLDRAQLRTLADSLRNKWRSAVIVLASVTDSDIAIVSAVSKDLTNKVQAGKLVGDVARQVGGKGGGRPDMAEGARQRRSLLAQSA